MKKLYNVLAFKSRDEEIMIDKDAEDFHKSDISKKYSMFDDGKNIDEEKEEIKSKKLSLMQHLIL